MVNCSHCGKTCDRRKSFNWKNGVLYLCSGNDACEKESRSWRLTKEQREQLEEIEKELENHVNE